MKSFSEYMNAYKKQLKKGDIQKAYSGLMEYFRGLKSYLKDKYSDYFVSSNIYHGYMDMTYFSFFPESIKNRNLKVAIVFIHETCRFEVWLAGNNRNVQKTFCKLIKESDWNKYHIGSTDKGIDYILDHILIADPDFSDLDALTNQIESGVLSFIKDVEGYLSKH
jgi:hypothetical protein